MLFYLYELVELSSNTSSSPGQIVIQSIKVSGCGPDLVRAKATRNFDSAEFLDAFSPPDTVSNHRACNTAFRRHHHAE
jgi:hypothetical protein